MGFDLQSFLFESEMFSDLDGDQLHTVSELAGLTRKEGGQYLFREGDEADNIYVIRKGTVQIRIESGQKEEYTPITQLGQHEVLGELTLFGNTRRSASAYLPEGEEVELVEFDRKEFKEMLFEEPDIGVHILAVIVENVSDRLRKMDQSHEVVFSALQEKHTQG